MSIGRPEVERAYAEWVDAPAGHKNAWRVAREHGGADGLIDELVDEIKGRRLKLRPIHRYQQVEPTNGKIRRIGVLSVKQQVLDYIIVTCAAPLLSAKVGYYQVSGVPGKGGAFAVGAVHRWLRDGSCRYFAKSDIVKCYPSASPDQMVEIYRGVIGSDDLMYCIERNFATYDAGMEVGSYLAQRSMALMFSYAYHHVESLSKMRRGISRPLVSHQIWQADDMVLFSNSKRDLKAAMRSMGKFLDEGYGLRIKPWKVCRVGEDEPVDICGCAIRPSHIEIRARTFLRARRAFRSFARRPTLDGARRVCSYYGLFLHADCYKVMQREGMPSIAARARRMVSNHDRKVLDGR